MIEGFSCCFIDLLVRPLIITRGIDFFIDRELQGDSQGSESAGDGGAGADESDSDSGAAGGESDSGEDQ